jgi:hypothetical protein
VEDGVATDSDAADDIAGPKDAELSWQSKSSQAPTHTLSCASTVANTTPSTVSSLQPRLSTASSQKVRKVSSPDDDTNWEEVFDPFPETFKEHVFRQKKSMARNFEFLC